MDDMKKKKRIFLITIASLILIIIGTIFAIITIENNHQENMVVIDECYENFEDKEGITVSFKGNKVRCIEWKE